METVQFVKKIVKYIDSGIDEVRKTFYENSSEFDERESHFINKIKENNNMITIGNIMYLIGRECECEFISSELLCKNIKDLEDQTNINQFNENGNDIIIYILCTKIWNYIKLYNENDPYIYQNIFEQFYAIFHATKETIRENNVTFTMNKINIMYYLIFGYMLDFDLQIHKYHRCFNMVMQNKFTEQTYQDENVKEFMDNFSALSKIYENIIHDGEKLYKNSLLFY